MRGCTLCWESLPLTEEYFYPDKSKRTGFAPRCKECTKEYQKENRKSRTRKHGGKKHVSLSLEEVKDFCKGLGMEFLDSTYRRVKDKHTFMCVCGAEYQTSFEMVKYGHRCPECARKKLIESKRSFMSSSELEKKFTNKGLVLLDREYKGVKNKYKYICRCGNEYAQTLEELGKSARCWDCYITSVSGENSRLWKGGLDEGRNYREYRQWRNKVLDRDNNECIECSSTDELQVHHIIPYSMSIELRTEEDNGITLCKSCHSLFHKNIPLKDMGEDSFYGFSNSMSVSPEVEIDYNYETGDVCYNTIYS